MTQNWTLIVKSNWVFSKFYLLIYIYIYMTYKFELFLVIQKKNAHKYKRLNIKGEKYDILHSHQ